MCAMCLRESTGQWAVGAPQPTMTILSKLTMKVS
jgi:hypothetical protein